MFQAGFFIGIQHQHFCIFNANMREKKNDTSWCSSYKMWIFITKVIEVSTATTPTTFGHCHCSPLASLQQPHVSWPLCDLPRALASPDPERGCLSNWTSLLKFRQNQLLSKLISHIPYHPCMVYLPTFGYWWMEKGCGWIPRYRSWLVKLDHFPRVSGWKKHIWNHHLGTAQNSCGGEPWNISETSSQDKCPIYRRIDTRKSYSNWINFDGHNLADLLGWLNHGN